ncbi:zinc finger and BTB domain containing 20, isoform CRA_b [Mus musculus]|nr:zinc finger and BTB domain containing 20, isoform CRA_b [Mus musculus]
MVCSRASASVLHMATISSDAAFLLKMGSLATVHSYVGQPAVHGHVPLFACSCLGLSSCVDASFILIRPLNL